MVLTLKISEDSTKAFFSGIVLRWCLLVCFLREKALAGCAAVGFLFLHRTRRCRCVNSNLKAVYLHRYL